MSRKTAPKISRDSRYQRKSEYYKPGSDGYRFDNAVVAFGSYEETRNSKERRSKQKDKPLF